MAGYPLTKAEAERVKECTCWFCSLCYKRGDGSGCIGCETPKTSKDKCNCVDYWK
jgi:hypothetical protein